MIEVINTGIFTTIQDQGRFGFRNIGVPVSGSMDQYSAYVANSLVGNNQQSAVMEMTIIGPSLKFHENATIAIVGASVTVQLNGQDKKQNTIITIKKGETLTIGQIRLGVRCYLAISGGFDTETELNSHSFYAGVTKQSMLLKGDFVRYKTLGVSKIIHRSIVNLDVKHFSNHLLDVYPGPEFHTLSQTTISKILRKKIVVSSTSNRMGYKFEASISLGINEHVNEIVTSSVQPGTVQLTPAGDIIILMRDCQTTGGYARIFQLTEQSINQLSQKPTGSELLFHLF